MSKEVAKKIALVMADVDQIKKVKKGGVSYEFQAWEDVLPTVRASCIKHGLVIVPSMGQSEVSEYRKDSGASAQFCHNVPLRFLLLDVESGESIEAEWSGEARDVSDKGKQKAATSGMKYWLLKLFMVPDKESIAHDEAGTDEIKPNGQAPWKTSSTPAKTWLKENGVTAKHPALKKLVEKGWEWEPKITEWLSEGESHSLKDFEGYVERLGVKS